jgi:hypothetical protein
VACFSKIGISAVAQAVADHAAANAATTDNATAILDADASAAAAKGNKAETMPVADERQCLPDISCVALQPAVNCCDAAAVAQAAADSAASDAATADSAAEILVAETISRGTAAAAAADDIHAEPAPVTDAPVHLQDISSSTLLPPCPSLDVAAVAQAAAQAAPADAATTIAAAASGTVTTPAAAAAAAAAGAAGNSPGATASTFQDTTACLHLPGFGAVQLLTAPASPEAAALKRLVVTAAVRKQLGARLSSRYRLDHEPLQQQQLTSKSMQLPAYFEPSKLAVLMLLEMRDLTAIMQQPNADDLLNEVLVRYKLAQQQEQQQAREGDPAAAAAAAADNSAEPVPEVDQLLRMPEGIGSFGLLPPFSASDAAALARAAAELAAADAATTENAPARPEADTTATTAAAANSPKAMANATGFHIQCLHLPSFGAVQLLNPPASPEAATCMRLAFTDALRERLGPDHTYLKRSKRLSIMMLLDDNSFKAVMKQRNAVELLEEVFETYKLAQEQWQVQQRRKREQEEAAAAAAEDDAAAAAAAACSSAVLQAAATATDHAQTLQLPGYGMIQLLPAPANHSEALRMSFGFLRVFGSRELGGHVGSAYRLHLTQQAPKLAVLMRLPKTDRDALLRQPDAAELLDAVYVKYQLASSPASGEQQQQQQQQHELVDADSAVEGGHDKAEYFSADESDEYLSADEDSE